VRDGNSEPTDGNPKQRRKGHIEREPKEPTEGGPQRRLQEEPPEWHPPQKPERNQGPNEKAADPADDRGELIEFDANDQAAWTFTEQAKNSDAEHARRRACPDATKRDSDADGRDAGNSHVSRQ
jgi:hypothetical protein